MAFCSNCGHQLADGAKFCFECGAKVNTPETYQEEQRKTVYDGEIHKCPNCGEELNAFETTCPSCKWEVRDTKVSSAVSAFAEKIMQLEASGSSEINDDIINLIRTFPIPNTKEDIIEFLILASSNIDTNKTHRNAWETKLEQIYQKAKLTFGDNKEFTYVTELYAEAKRNLTKHRMLSTTQKIGKGILSVPSAIVKSISNWVKESKDAQFWCGFILIGCILWGAFSLLINSVKHEHTEKIGQLEILVEEVEKLIDAGDYDAARIKATQIVDDSDWSSDSEEKWNAVRDSLLETIDRKEGVVNHSVVSTDTIAEAGKVACEAANIKGFTFSIPNYWSEEGSKNEHLQYYAEKGDGVVMMSISYPQETDSSYPVTFDGLHSDNDNMINSVAAMFTDGDVVDHEIFESDYGVKGILYRFTYRQEIDWLTTVDGSGYCFCFPAETERRWFYVTLLYTNNVSIDEYKEDYMNLLSNIKEKS